MLRELIGGRQIHAHKSIYLKILKNIKKNMKQ